ncbi:MAG: hypothetical protein LBU39_03690 [Desulfobulbaceae bacterium]|jgi:hypothetical protein|nr:hypothetical protein [Desulfobulbaceae bacterium]
MLKKIFTIGLLALPVVGGAAFLHQYGVNVLFWDEFHFAPLATRETWPDLTVLFRQHNEHRIFFPNILYLLIAKASAMNSLAAMWASFALVTMLYSAILWALSRADARRSQATPMLGFTLPGLLIGVMLFYPSQWENILWGFQLGFYMTFVFSMLAFLCFSLALEQIGASGREFAWLFITSIVCAVIASFSSGQGLMVWPVLTALWLVAQSGKKTLATRPFWIWLAAGIGCWLLYFHGYHKPNHHPSLTTITDMPIQFEEYLLALFGGAVGWPKSPILLGAIGILVLGGMTICLAHFCIFCFTGRASEQSIIKSEIFAVSVIGYSFLSGLSIVVGRAGLGWQQALSSRYCTFTLAMLWGILLYLAVSPNLGKAGSRSRLAAYICFPLVTAMLFAAWPSNMNMVENEKIQKRLRQYYLQTAKWQSDENLKRLFPAPERVRQDAARLREKGYNAFADLRARTPDWPTIQRIAMTQKMPMLFLDRADVTTGKHPLLQLRGWTFDPKSKKAAQSVWLALGKERFLLFYGAPRKDVAQALKNADLSHLGFTADIPLAALQPGDYPLTILVVSADGKNLYERAQGVRLSHDAHGWRLMSLR